MLKTNLPDGITSSFEPEEGSPEAAGLGMKEYFVLVVIAGTITIWVCFDSLSDTFGNIGVAALIPVLVFFGSGLLSKGDFDSLPWNVIILMGGGLALGTAVQTSGLLDIVASKISSAMDGKSLWVVLLVFNLVVAVTANFISSTVSAIIFLPLIANIGLANNHVNALCISAAVMTSGAMGLPVSSFPNANAYAITREDGTCFLGNRDFVVSGFTMTVIVLTILSTVGYGLSMLLGF